MAIRLANGPWSCTVDPAAGGVVTALFHGDVAILRETGPGATHPLAYACFPLVPYANRIANGRWPGGPAQALRPNLDGQVHPLHGLGWLSNWVVTRQSDNGVRLSFTHENGPGWPYPFFAEQRLRLTTNGLIIVLAMTNRDTAPRPAGLGLHPYFRRQRDTRVQFAADAVMHSDHDCLPSGQTMAASQLGDFANADGLKAVTIDHCYTGWRQAATISDTLGKIHLFARGTPFLHLYAPPVDDILCLEPVSHGPNAHNRAPHELRWLQPGERMAIAVRIGVG